MGRVQRRIVRGVLSVVDRPRLTLVIAGVALLACATLAFFRLDISTDQNKLFSPKAKFFGDYLEFVEKFPENEAVYVVIERIDKSATPSLERWTEVADTIAAKVRRLGPEFVRSVEDRVPVEQLGNQGLLFEEPEAVAKRVEEVRRSVPLVRILGEKPALLTQVLGQGTVDRFLGAMNAAPVDAEQARFADVVVRGVLETLDDPAGAVRLPKLEKLGAISPRDLGYSWVNDATDAANPLLLVRVYPTRTFDSLDAVLKPIEAIRGAVREAAAGFPEFRVGITGRPTLAADEMRTSDRDSHRAEAVALTVVFIGLVLFTRSLWLAVAAEISLVVAIGWTFGWAELAVGQLNLLSLVFLIALIGIGMDYLVQILVRYRQEATRHASPRAVWARVFRHVGPPINTACLGAAGAFLVAVFTDFRGASELGIIAGGGLLLCLLSGYTVLPAILTLVPGKFSLASRKKRAIAGAAATTIPVPLAPEGRKTVAPGASPGTFTDETASPVGAVELLPPLRGYPLKTDDADAGDHPGLAPRATFFRPSGAGASAARRGDAGVAATGDRARAGGARLLMPAVWGVLLLIGSTVFAPRTGFNPNLLELQAQNLESVQLVRKLQTDSAVVLSKDLDVLRQVRDAVKDLPTVASTDSLLKAYDNAEWLAANAKLPAIDWADPVAVDAGDLNRLRDKARALSKKFAAAIPSAKPQATGGAGGAAGAFQNAANTLALLADRLSVPGDDVANRDRIVDRLNAWQPAFVGQLRTLLGQFNPGPPRVAELPAGLRGHYVADDGTAALYIYPREILWSREALARFIQTVEPAVLSVPGSPAPTGIAMDIFYTTASIERSFYTSTAYALALIFVLVLIDLRNLGQTFLAIGVLALGLPMLVSIMGLIGADWNFANFFGLPILIGAGHEYGVFMVHRYREAIHDPRRYWRRWDASDKALLLCAYVTCSSFGFFWLLANHEGLKSLGLVMALGTACIYLATLLVVRPLLLWRLKRHAARSAS